MRLVALLLAVMLAGCAHTHTTAAVGAGTAAGATTTGGSVSVHGHGHGLAALIIAGMFIAAAADDSRAPYSRPAAMAAGRRINEQDCTKPIDESAGNLKCR